MGITRFAIAGVSGLGSLMLATTPNGVAESLSAWALVAHWTKLSLWLSGSSAQVVLGCLPWLLAALCFLALCWPLVVRYSPWQIHRNPIYSHGKIEIRHKIGEPYEKTEIKSDKIRSTVSIGLKNIGGKTLSNCRVTIDKILPPHPHIHDQVMMLGNTLQTIRMDDPEIYIGVCEYWSHINKFRFLLNEGGLVGPFELNWIDAIEERMIVIKATSEETHKTSVFKISLDENKILRMKFVSDGA